MVAASLASSAALSIGSQAFLQPMPPAGGSRATAMGAVGLHAAGGSAPSKVCGGSSASRSSAACLGGLVALAAARRKKKEDEPKASTPLSPVAGRLGVVMQGDLELKPNPEIDGEGLPDMAGALNVTEEDRRRRMELRKERAKQQQGLDRNVDFYKELLDREDPDLFGVPYNWLEISHLVLGVSAIIALIASSAGLAKGFILFDLKGPALFCLRTSMQLAAAINLVNAGITYKEELDNPTQEGKEPNDNEYAIGWAIKSLFLGGLISWQRFGGKFKVELRKKEEEIQKERSMRFRGQMASTFKAAAQSTSAKPPLS